MSRSEPVVFQIGGPVRDPEIARRLVVAISETTLGAYEDDDEFEHVDDIVDHLEGALMTDLEIHARAMTQEEIQAFEQVCQDLGLSYLRKLTDKGTEDEIHWVPGLPRPISSSMVGSGTSGEVDYGVPLELVREAASKGLDAIGELIAAYDMVHRTGLVIDLDPDVIVKLRTLEGPEWDTPITAKPVAPSPAP